MAGSGRATDFLDETWATTTQTAYYVVHDMPLDGGTDGIYLSMKPVLGSLLDLDKSLTRSTA